MCRVIIAVTRYRTCERYELNSDFNYISRSGRARALTVATQTQVAEALEMVTRSRHLRRLLRPIQHQST